MTMEKLMDRRFQIGWYTVPKDKEYTDNGYECAAWYKRILVKAGRYPVMARKFQFHERERRMTDQLEDRTISIKLTGTVTADDFAGRFCGNLIDKENPKFNQYVGEESELYLSPYSHAVAKSIIEGTSQIELLPQFQAREIHFEYNGEPKVTYGIFTLIPTPTA